MAYNRVNVTKYAVRYGLIIAVCCIIYFLIMRLFDVHFMIELSLLNAVIMVIGIFFAIRGFKKAKNGMIDYLDGLGLGFLTSAIAALLFGGFMVAYANLIDNDFLQNTTANQFFGENLSLLTLFGYVVLELVISGAIAGFVFMQLFKRPDHKLSNS